MAIRTGRDHAHVRLIHILLINEIVAGLGGMGLDFRLGNRRSFGQTGEGVLQFLFHRSGIEVATDADDHVVGVDVFLMPGEQVIALDRLERGVLHLASVRIVGTVGKLGGLARGNRAGIVVAAGDRLGILLLGEVELVGAEFGIVNQIENDLEHVVEIVLEAGPSEGGRVNAAAGFDLGGAALEVIVHLIAGLGFRAAGAPDIAIELDETDLLRRFVTRSTANADGAVNQREFVIFLQENHQAVGQLDALGLSRMEGRQSGNGNLLPFGSLGVREGQCAEKQHHQRKDCKEACARRCGS